MLTRRAWIRSALSCSLSAAIHRPAFARFEPAAADLHVSTGALLATIPSDFIGLGYEESSVATPGLLSRENIPYVRLVRNLGHPGVVRAGGIVADFTTYSPDAIAANEPKHTVITRSALQRFRAFLDEVQWTTIWSVNFGRGTLDQAVQAARDVAAILGPRLLAIELGNEVENYSHGATPLRPPPYGFADYRAEYARWRQAMLAAVPGLRFAAPDTAASIDWVERMAAGAQGDVQLLTTHYYRGDQKLGTLEQLMKPDRDLEDKLERLSRASRQSGIPWRMCEMNSFFGGGRPGLSDTMAGALWTLDIMLLLASYGCGGVNIETGVNQLGFISSYSPIQDDGNTRNTAGASYYGMLAFAIATAEASEIFPTELASGGANLTAYALGSHGRVSALVLLNKTVDQSARVSLRSLPRTRYSVLRLTAPSILSFAGITFGGASVTPTGRWKPGPELLSDANEILMPPASAIVLRENPRR